MRELPAGTVTFLFTDIEGSTRLLHELGPDEYAGALTEHRRIVRAAFTSHGGVEVDTQGDAFFIAFADAWEAVGAAEEARRALADGPIQVRMGLHTGEPTLIGEGYVGVDVHEGARIAAAAHGGQIVCSLRTKELAGDAVAFIDLGEHRLKDMPDPIWIFQLGEGTFPPLKTLSNTNLPFPASSFIGRERELEEAADLLERSRLVTILGPGGAGKTRFSIELASRQVERFPNGVFWVPLATITDPATVIETASRVLGSKNGLAEHIGERRMMLLFDNLEQVIDASSNLGRLAEACPNLTIIVTSRELMKIRGEHPYPLPALETDEGVTLFTERAGVDVSDAVVELCRRLEGLPLAIELAAARATVMTPEQLLARLRDRLDFLRGGRDADPRQRTLRATIEWSHDLLDDEERRAFARLGVFIGGWTLESAKAVAQVDVDVVQSLVEKSLARRTDERFWMLETIREFAVERLENSGEAPELRRRYAESMLALAESANLNIDSPGPQRHDLVLPELDNMRAALAWAAASDQREFGLRLTMALENIWVSSNPMEGMRWYAVLLEGADGLDPLFRARVMRDYGGCAFLSGARDLARKLNTESLELFRAAGDERNVGELIHRFAVDATVRRDIDEARKLLQESLDIALACGNRWGECQVLGTLAHVVRAEGDLDGAADLFRQSGALAREVGNVWWETNMIANLAELDLIAGRYDEAASNASTVVSLSRARDNRSMFAWGLAYLARVAVARDDLERAGLLWGAVLAEQTRRQLPNAFEDDPDWVELVGPLMEIQDAAFERGRSEGQRLSLEEAADRSLAPE